MKPLVLSFSISRYPSSSFGDYIRKARREKGLKQREVAESIGVDEQTITNWEIAEHVPMHNYQKVKQACPALGISYEELLKRFCLLWKDNHQHFGRELLKARIVSGLTQEETANMAGVDPSTLARWEKSGKLPPKWMAGKLSTLRRVLTANGTGTLRTGS